MNKMYILEGASHEEVEQFKHAYDVALETGQHIDFITDRRVTVYDFTNGNIYHPDIRKPEKQSDFWVGFTVAGFFYVCVQLLVEIVKGL